MTAPLPDNEVERLVALYNHYILDSEPTHDFDDLVRLAAHVCGVPIAAVSLVDKHRQWFKAVFGLDVRETPRGTSFCAHTILEPDILVVPDAQADPRFADSPLVTGTSNVRFYAGVPLVTEEGYALGSLCIIDSQPRTLTPAQQETLRLLGRQAAGLLRAARQVAAHQGVVAENERRLLERELGERDQLRLAAIVESADEAIIAGTLDGTIVAWNRGAERLYGYSAADVIGQHMSVLAPDSEKQLGREVAARLLGGQELETMEVVRTRKDGTQIDVLLSFSPIRDAAGQVVGGSCVSRDITDRKRVEAALAASEARLRRLSDAAFEGIVVSQDGVLVDVNRAFVAMYGCDDPGEVLGLAPWQLAAPDSRALVLQKVADCDEEPYEAVCLRRDGSTFIGELRGRLTEHNGRPARVTSIRDITAHKEAQDALRRSETSLRAVLESAPIILYATDAAGTVTLSEGNGLTALGLKPGEAIGRSVIEFCGSPENAARTRRVLAGEAISWDAQMGNLCLHTHLQPVSGADGAPSGLIGVCYDVTERKQAETQLAESRQRLALATNSARMGVWDWDVPANRLLWDDRMYRVFGVSRQDFGGAYEAWQKTLHPDDRDRAVAELQAALDGDGNFHSEFRIVWPGGAVRHIEAHATIQRDADGAPLRVTGVNWDVTARRRADERFRVLFEQSSDAHLLLGEGGIIDCNPAAVAFLRCADKAQVLSLHPAVLSPEYQPDGRRSDEKCIEMDALARENGFHRFEWIHRKMDGEDFPVEVTLTPVVLEERSVLLLVWHDLTDRKRAEDALRESEARLRLALSSGRFGSFELDLAAQRFLGVSDIYCSLFGLIPGGELTLDALIALIHPEDRDHLSTITEQAIAAGQGYQVEHRVVRPDGVVCWVSVHATPILDDAGRPVRLLGVVQDISERKALEAERERLAERERTIATRLQAALQPPPEHVPGLQVGSLTQPALDEAQVGGDFYDVFPLGGDQYALVIGDVSGKGLAAAVQLALIRNSLRTTLYLCPQPAQAATQLNAIVTAHNLLVGFVTAWVGVYDMSTGRITYASCAHEPGLVRRLDGTVEALETTGPPLGMDAAATYGEMTVTLGVGDHLLLHTDGLPESGPSRREMLGTEGMIRLLAGLPTGPEPQALAAALVAQAAANADGVFRDDVTVLLARRGEGK